MTYGKQKPDVVIMNPVKPAGMSDCALDRLRGDVGIKSIGYIVEWWDGRSEEFGLTRKVEDPDDDI